MRKYNKFMNKKLSVYSLDILSLKTIQEEKPII